MSLYQAPPLESSFPGSAANDAFSHPALVAMMAAALFHALDVPLIPGQRTAFDRTDQHASDAVARATDGATEREFLLEAVIDESEAKLAFATALRALLTPEQHALLSPASIRDLVGYDLFGPAQMWVGIVEAGAFPAGTDVGAVIAKGLSRELGFDPMQKAALTAEVSDWWYIQDPVPASWISPSARPVIPAGSSRPSAPGDS